MIVTGGKTIAGAAVGILMLESQFPRIPGDGGNASTWPFPLLYKVVAGATPERVVEQGADGLLDDFIAGGQELVAAGADGITTNCGFLTLYQSEYLESYLLNCLRYFSFLFLHYLNQCKAWPKILN